jgi:hypothetical protein
MAVRRLEQQFESFVVRLFTEAGFHVQPNPYGDESSPDLLVTSASGQVSIVEVKLFRSRAIPSDLVLRIANQAEMYRRRFEAGRAVLITLAQVPVTQVRMLIRENPRLVILDLNSLRSAASRDLKLAEELESIARDALPSAPEPSRNLDFFPIDITLLDAEPPESENLTIQEAIQFRGAALCHELMQIRGGRPRARQFELKCEKALRYIFQTDLAAWSSQKVSDRGLSRYDLIARISSTHDMWRMLVERFNSQYVIFEFKNYSVKVKQGEIYTTEKYLFAKAMRTTAIIVSRTGADKNALEAARGALREHGKLIINLSVDDMCKLLALKDSDDDCSGYLFQIVDEMLMKLER